MTLLFERDAFHQYDKGLEKRAVIVIKNAILGLYSIMSLYVLKDSNANHILDIIYTRPYFQIIEKWAQ